MKAKSTLYILIFSFIFVILILVLALMQKKDELSNVKLTKSIGEKDIVETSLTYISKKTSFDDIFTCYINNEKLENKVIPNIKTTLGFADVTSLDKYAISNGYKENPESFLKEYGYVYLYYKHKESEYYLLQNKSKKPNVVWNVLIKRGGDYELVNLCNDIQAYDERGNYHNAIFAKKVEYKDDKIYFYLSNGIYALDENNNIEVKEINLNKIFSQIESKVKYTKLYTTKIEYIEDCFYVLCKDETKYYLIQYDIENEEVLFVPLNYNAQNITVINQNVMIISTEKNKVYLETYNKSRNESTIREIMSINKHKLCDIRLDGINPIIVYENTISFALSGDFKKQEKTYTVTIEKESLNLLNFREYTSNSQKYYIYGISMYVN